MQNARPQHSRCAAVQAAHRVTQLEARWDQLWRARPSPADNMEAIDEALFEEIERARNELCRATPSSLDGAVAQLCAAQRDLFLDSKQSQRRAEQLVATATTFLKEITSLSCQSIIALSLTDYPEASERPGFAIKKSAL